MDATDGNQPWDDERFKRVTHLLVYTIGDYAHVKCHGSMEKKPKPINFFASAARYIVNQCVHHETKVASELQLGGEKFYDFLNYADKVDIKKDKAFAPFKKVMVDFKDGFDAFKKDKLEEYQNYKGVDAIGMCFENARGEWAETHPKQLKKLYDMIMKQQVQP